MNHSSKALARLHVAPTPELVAAAAGYRRPDPVRIGRAIKAIYAATMKLPAAEIQRIRDASNAKLRGQTRNGSRSWTPEEKA
jgi:hypothetical protein